MEEITYSLIINKGTDEGFESYLLDKEYFLKGVSNLLKPPKKVFLGLGDFLEVGDYTKLLDSIFFDEDGTLFENILDKNNRKIAEDENIPLSFFKMAVYFPDFLLKSVPTFCASVIGKKSRLFPGAENFVKHIKKFDPTVLSAMPHEIAIEFMRRVGLDDSKLIATQYLTQKEGNHDVYAGGVKRFVSGERKSLEIERTLAMKGLKDEDSVYIGSGEAGLRTFSTVNSIAFNTPSSIAAHSRISVYGSSVESLLVLFNFNGELDSYLMQESMEEYLPSLVVFSDQGEKPEELLEIEMEHLLLQNNIIGQRIEYLGESFASVERDIDITLGGSFVNMEEVRYMIGKRLQVYKDNPMSLLKQIYRIARQRKNFSLLEI